MSAARTPVVGVAAAQLRAARGRRLDALGQSG